MLPADEMPEDNADLANVEVDFPRLDPDLYTPSSYRARLKRDA